eukprot:gnl/Chilomastix_caulleri/6728.p3 GENE.gnl/Chilomastix_caulleri/6728~~gnl/Chilomastix_caulleri/6728.p3  ORF type:complete len:67 (-),score=14.77 gnl/Chilomastix_caulleri/6728:82-282(-)
MSPYTLASEWFGSSVRGECNSGLSPITPAQPPPMLLQCSADVRGADGGGKDGCEVGVTACLVDHGD